MNKTTNKDLEQYQIIWTTKSGSKEIIDVFDNLQEALAAIPEYQAAYNTKLIDVAKVNKEME